MVSRMVNFTIGNAILMEYSGAWGFGRKAK